MTATLAKTTQRLKHARVNRAYDCPIKFPRGLPQVGQDVLLVYAGSVEPGTIVAVLDDARRLTVRDSKGDVADFTLLPATARYTADDGSRLSFPA